MTTTAKRRWFLFTLRQMMLEVVFVAVACAALRFACSTPDFLVVRILALYATFGAAIGNLVGRPGLGAIIGACSSPTFMVAMIIWPPS